MKARTTPANPIWLVSWAFACGIVLGFSLGTYWFLTSLTGKSLFELPAVGRAHGHVQLYGFTLALTIGVAYWFLPRLWGTPFARSDSVRAVLALWGTGMIVHLVGLLAGMRPIALLGTGLETAGAVLVARDLVRLVWTKPTGDKGRDPAVVVAVTSFSLAVPTSLLLEFVSLLPLYSMAHQLSLLLNLYCALLPVAFAMSGRLFPLYFRTRLPYRRLLAGSIGVLAVGTVMRCGGLVSGSATGLGLGGTLQGLGMLGALAALRLVEARQPRPTAQRSLWKDPAAWLAVIAYAWLAIAAGWVIWWVGIERTTGSSLEWHLLGAGYLMGLIVAVGSYLLPGLMRRPARPSHTGWILAILTVLMAIFRVGAELGGGVEAALMGTLAGLVGTLVLILLAWRTGVFAPWQRV